MKRLIMTCLVVLLSWSVAEANKRTGGAKPEVSRKAKAKETRLEQNEMADYVKTSAETAALRELVKNDESLVDFVKAELANGASKTEVQTLLKDMNELALRLDDAAFADAIVTTAKANPRETVPRLPNNQQQVKDQFGAAFSKLKSLSDKAGEHKDVADLLGAIKSLAQWASKKENTNGLGDSQMMNFLEIISRTSEMNETSQITFAIRLKEDMAERNVIMENVRGCK